MEKIKVGLFIDTFFPMIDGVINVVDNYAKRLKDKCEVIVFCPKGRKDFDDSKLPYKVVRCKKKFPMVGLDYDLPMPSVDKDFKKELTNSNLDIVHIHSPFSIGKIGLTYAKEHNIPVVATMHSQFKRDFKKAVGTEWFANLLLKKIMKVFNGCDECWAVNEEIARIYFSDYGAKKMPEVQINGTDINYFTNDDEITKLRSGLNIKEDEKVFLFVGRIDVIKNILFIVDVLKILKEKNMKFKMIFVGSGKDEGILKKYITKQELDNEVLLVGKIKDRIEISKYYKLSDLFLFPSLYDASSLVQIEAASQGTPTVFLEGAATAATVTNNVNGYIFPNDLEKFAQGVLEIFENDRLYNEICKNAHNQLFKTWDDVVDKAFNDYIRLINEKKSY